MKQQPMKHLVGEFNLLALSASRDEYAKIKGSMDIVQQLSTSRNLDLIRTFMLLLKCHQPIFLNWVELLGKQEKIFIFAINEQSFQVKKMNPSRVYPAVVSGRLETPQRKAPRFRVPIKTAIVTGYDIEGHMSAMAPVMQRIFRSTISQFHSTRHLTLAV